MAASSEFQTLYRTKGIIVKFHCIHEHQIAYNTRLRMDCIDLHQQQNHDLATYFWLASQILKFDFSFYLSLLWWISNAFIYFAQRESPTYGII